MGLVNNLQINGGSHIPCVGSEFVPRQNVHDHGEDGHEGDSDGVDDDPLVGQPAVPIRAVDGGHTHVQALTHRTTHALHNTVQQDIQIGKRVRSNYRDFSKVERPLGLVQVFVQNSSLLASHKRIELLHTFTASAYYGPAACQRFSIERTVNRLCEASRLAIYTKPVLTEIILKLKKTVIDAK